MNAIAQSSAAPASGPQLDNRRVLAGLIDLAIVVAGTVVIGFATGIYGGDNPVVSLPVAAVMTAWALYYYFACESGGGQTLGKKLMRLRVVRVDGRPAEMGDIAVRTVVRIVDMQFVYLVGLITMLATGKRRGRLGDLAAGTMVVSADGPAAPPPPVATPTVAAAAPATETLTLPSRGPEAIGSAPVAPEVAPATAGTEVPELRPFEPFAEPADDPVVEETVVSAAFPVDDDPVVEPSVAEPAFPVADDPVVEETVVSPACPVDDELADPVDDLADLGSHPDDAVLEPAFPVEDLSELDRYADDAVAEPAGAADDLTALDSLDDEDDEPDVVVKSIDTVSAIDLVMGDDDPLRDEPEADSSVDSDRQ